MNITVTLLAALALFSHAGALAQSEDPCNESLIQKTAAQVSANLFNYKRGLLHYIYDLGGEVFVSTLDQLSLREDWHWIDMGAGSVRAMREYPFFAGLLLPRITREEPNPYNSMIWHEIDLKDEPVRRPPFMTAINHTVAPGYRPQIEDFKEAYSDRFQMFEGRFLQTIPRSEIKKADLITDVYGPFHYADTANEILEIYFDRLNLDGYLFISLPNRHMQGISTAPENYYPETGVIVAKSSSFQLLDQNGYTADLRKWLAAFRGVETGISAEAVWFKKVATEVHLPPLEVLEVRAEAKSGAPTRIFQITLAQ